MDNETIANETMANETTPDLIQYVTTAVSILCALTSMIAYKTHPKWRKRNHLYAKQLFVKSTATCCTLLIIVLPEDMEEISVVIFLSIVAMTVLGTVHTVAIGHIHVALSCEDLSDEESMVAISWYYTTAVTCMTLYAVMYVLRLELLKVECIGAVLLLAISTANVMLLSLLFKDVNKCNVNVILVLTVNTLGIICDVLLILYAGVLLIIGNSTGLAYDVVIVTYTGTMLVQTILIMFSKDATDWNKCKPSRDEIIEM